MSDNSGQDDQARRAGESIQVSALIGFAALISPDVEQIAAARGTVNTNVDAIERPYYGDRSETLLNGTPVGTGGPEPPRHRAKDLIAELKMINGQIHRIMFQVERAVTRLGIAG